MKILQVNIFYLLVVVCLSSCTQKIYVVRHAEKEIGGIDPNLSPIGYDRSDALKNVLMNKKIKQIFSTNTKRTMQTATPLSNALNIPINKYEPVPDKKFVDSIQSTKKNTLFVGHSNTVDDIINGFLGEKKMKDLKDQTYNRLFIITVKGKNKTFEEKNYGN